MLPKTVFKQTNTILAYNSLAKYTQNTQSKNSSGATVNATSVAIKSYDAIPGPRQWPLVGSLFSLKGLGKLLIFHIRLPTRIFKSIFYQKVVILI